MEGGGKQGRENRANAAEGRSKRKKLLLLILILRLLFSLLSPFFGLPVVYCFLSSLTFCFIFACPNILMEQNGRELK